jgi:hypothetical protein
MVHAWIGDALMRNASPHGRFVKHAFPCRDNIGIFRKRKPLRGPTGGSAKRSISGSLVAGVHNSAPGDCESS